MFEERLRIAGVILKHLRRTPKRYTELLKLTLSDSATPGSFRSTIIVFDEIVWTNHNA